MKILEKSKKREKITTHFLYWHFDDALILTKKLKKTFPLFLLLTCLMGCQTLSTPAPTFYLGGIQVNEPDHDEWVSILKDVGMNTVSVTVYARQGIWNSDNIWWEVDEPYVIKEIRAAKKQGMQVVLIPRILLDHYFEENSFLWHGMVMPASDSLLSNWFQSYTTFVDKWAKICEQEKVDIMAIGSEMRVLSATQPLTKIPNLEAYYLNPIKQKEYINDRMNFRSQIPPEDLWVRGKDVNYQSLQKYLQDEVATKIKWAEAVAFADTNQPLDAINQRRATLLQHWYSLIKQVRSSFSGQLTYAANFDNYQNIKFWDQLDFIGINAYFKLRQLKTDINREDLFEELAYSWDTIFQNLDQFRHENALSQPAIFTELGYVYRENCTVMPWEGFGFSIAHTPKEKKLLVWRQQKHNLIERALAVKALHQANQKHQLLKGILYWKLTTKDYHLPHEPFGLHIQRTPKDPLQDALVRFLK